MQCLRYILGGLGDLPLVYKLLMDYRVTYCLVNINLLFQLL